MTVHAGHWTLSCRWTTHLPGFAVNSGRKADGQPAQANWADTSPSSEGARRCYLHIEAVSQRRCVVGRKKPRSATRPQLTPGAGRCAGLADGQSGSSIEPRRPTSFGVGRRPWMLQGETRPTDSAGLDSLLNLTARERSTPSSTASVKDGRPGAAAQPPRSRESRPFHQPDTHRLGDRRSAAADSGVGAVT